MSTPGFDIPPRSALADWPRLNAQAQPDEVAIVFGKRRITFGEHFRHAHKLAGALAAAGLRHQARIAVLSRNSPEYLEVYSAAQMSGFIVATVNFRLASPEIHGVLADAAPEILFFESQHGDIVAALRAKLPSIRKFICLDAEPETLGAAADGVESYTAFRAAGQPDAARLETTGRDTMHLIYTSGTTGKPKGVMRSHDAEAEVAGLMTTEVGVLRGDVVQIMMPLFHVGARWLQLGAQARGARIVLHREVDALELLHAMEDEAVTVTHMAPTIVQLVFEHPRVEDFDLHSLKAIYYSAAPMPLPLLQRCMQRLGAVFVQAYGMTEGFATTLHKNQHLPDGSEAQKRRLRSVGQASTGVRLRIVDDDGHEQPVGVPGEIMTFTTTRMTGYWNNSIATADALCQGWYRTGDVGFLDDHGFLYLVDRKKDMIISGGENIYCREVEDAVIQHPDVTDVAVIGLKDPRWGESVAAIVVCRPGATLSEQDIIDHCRPLLASYKKPRKVVFASELPRLTTGKIDKVALRKRHCV